MFAQMERPGQAPCRTAWLRAEILAGPLLRAPVALLPSLGLFLGTGDAHAFGMGLVTAVAIGLILRAPPAPAE